MECKFSLRMMHDVGAMGFGRLHTQTQGHGNFLCALSFRQQLYDFAFSGREELPNTSFIS